MNVVSSNSVLWDGPAIPSLGIEPGQKLTTLVHAMATKLLEITPSSLDLSKIDFSSLVSSVEDYPQDLESALSLLISQSSSSSAPSGITLQTISDVLENIYVAVPLQYQKTNEEGDKVTAEQISDFIKRLAVDITTLGSAISTLTGNTGSLITRMDKLSQDFANLDPATKSDLEVVYKGQIRQLQSAIALIDEDIKDAGNRVGTEAQVAAALASVPGMGAINMLSAAQTYSAHPLWTANPLTIAQLLVNQSILIDDVHRYTTGDVSPVLVTSNQLQLQFNVSVNITQTQITWDLIGSSLPNGFNAVTGGTTPQIQISDGSTTETFNVGIDPIAALTSAQTIDLSASSLAVNTELTLTLTCSLTNGSNDFVKTASTILSVPCMNPPVQTLTLTESGADEITANWVLPEGIYPRLGAYTIILQLRDANGLAVGGEIVLQDGTTTHVFTGQVGAALTRTVDVSLRYTCGVDSVITSKTITINGCISSNATVTINNQSVNIPDLNDDQSNITVNSVLVTEVNSGAVVASQNNCSGQFYIQASVQPYSSGINYLQAELYINGAVAPLSLDSNTEARTGSYVYTAADGSTPTIELRFTDQTT